jgi:hypothetical protein
LLGIQGQCKQTPRTSGRQTGLLKQAYFHYTMNATVGSSTCLSRQSTNISKSKVQESQVANTIPILCQGSQTLNIYTNTLMIIP